MRVVTSAVARTDPLGDSTITSSPSAIPKRAAVSGCMRSGLDPASDATSSGLFCERVCVWLASFQLMR